MRHPIGRSGRFYRRATRRQAGGEGRHPRSLEGRSRSGGHPTRCVRRRDSHTATGRCRMSRYASVSRITSYRSLNSCRHIATRTCWNPRVAYFSSRGPGHATIRSEFELSSLRRNNGFRCPASSRSATRDRCVRGGDVNVYGFAHIVGRCSQCHYHSPTVAPAIAAEHTSSLAPAPPLPASFI